MPQGCPPAFTEATPWDLRACYFQDPVGNSAFKAAAMTPDFTNKVVLPNIGNQQHWVCDNLTRASSAWA